VSEKERKGEVIVLLSKSKAHALTYPNLLFTYVLLFLSGTQEGTQERKTKAKAKDMSARLVIFYS
jgi:hypothetical protein